MIDNIVSLGDRTYKCVDSELKGDGKTKRVGVKYTWRSVCECKKEYFFSCFPWQFPFRQVGRISTDKIVKYKCYACYKKKVKSKPKTIAEALEGPLCNVITKILRAREPLTSAQVQADICEYDDETFMTWFPAPEHKELAKRARAAIKNANRKKSNGIISKVITAGKTAGLYKYHSNKWYNIDSDKISEDKGKNLPINRRKLDSLEEAARIVQVVLSFKPDITAPEIREHIKTNSAGISKAAASRLSINAEAIRARSIALMRVLKYMEDQKLVKRTKPGLGAQWSLLEGAVS